MTKKTKDSAPKAEVGLDTEAAKSAKNGKLQKPSQTNASTSNSSTSSPLPHHNHESVSTAGTSGADTSVSVGVSPSLPSSINTAVNVPTGHHITKKSDQ